MPQGPETIILDMGHFVVAAENPLGYVVKKNGILHHHFPIGRVCPREILCFLLQV